MSVSLNLTDLMEYTDWERRKRYELLRQQGDRVLEFSVGPHGDGRFESVGDMIRHIFSAEKRYVERLSGRPLTDVACIPKDSIEALFGFGQQSRKELRELLAQGVEWDAPQDFKILDYQIKVTPKKIVTHILMHEIRHWAQIATLLRLNGVVGDFHDFLFSPAMGGEFSRERANA